MTKQMVFTERAASNEYKSNPLTNKHILEVVACNDKTANEENGRSARLIPQGLITHIDSKYK